MVDIDFVQIMEFIVTPILVSCGAVYFVSIFINLVRTITGGGDYDDDV